MYSKETTLLQQTPQQLYTENTQKTEEQKELETYSEAFLQEQKTVTTMKVEQMSGLQRVFNGGLDYSSPVEKVAPLNEESLRGLSRADKKAIKKAHKADVKKQERLEAQNKKEELEKATKKQAEISTVEAYLKNPEVYAYAKKYGEESNLNPDNYVGGEDDVINTTILKEMERIPEEFGLAKEETAESGGYTIENLQKIKELNSRLRYKKWRMRLTSGLLADFCRDTRQYAQSNKFSIMADRESDEILLLDRMFQTSIAELINHKNFKVPENTKAKVKKRDYNIEKVHDLDYHYKNAKIYAHDYKKFDELRRDTSFSRALFKAGTEEAIKNTNESGLPKEIVDKVNSDVKFRSLVPSAAAILKKALADNPPPAAPEKMAEYKKALSYYINTLAGYSATYSNYHSALKIRENNPDIFKDPESSMSIKQKATEESELELFNKSRDIELPEALEKLKAASKSQ